MNPDLARLVRLQRADSELRRVEAELGLVPRRKAELQDLEARRSRYKGQLMEVKTNKEYTAMLHEIEGVEREIRGREDQVLAEMEKAETLAVEVKRAESAFKAAEQEHRAQERRLEEEDLQLRERARRLAAERDAEGAQLPPPLLDLFHRVARLRGVAVAEARDGMCQVCHLKLRPQMYMDLKRNEQIMQCPACNRILYYEVAAPVSSAQP